MKKENEEVFAMYARYYDLLYRDKDYSTEADYVISLLKKFSADASGIVDMGCGTGKHAIEFAKRGYRVTGVEMSEAMLALAGENLKKSGMRNDSVKFLKGNIAEITTGEKYDAAFALFHVMGYLTDNALLNKGISNIARHLNDGGIFIFDFWYGPAVLNQRPEKRTKLLKGNNLTVKRQAFPEIFVNRNVVDVKYLINAVSDTDTENLELEETHSMRYFFIPELILLLEHNGFNILRTEEWMTGKELSEESWSGVCVAEYKGIDR